MLETVLQSKPGVIGLIRSVHGLQVEVLEFQLFEALRQSAFLRKYQLELTSTPYQKLGARFGTYTDPIDAFWNRLGSVRLHGDHETVRMKRCDQGLIELKEWFPASADNESPRPRRAIGRLTRTPHPSTWETTASAIKPEFARIMQVEERLRAGKKDQLSARRWGELEFRTTVLMGAPDVLDTYSGFRAWFGIETRDPTSDRRVVEYCFAIPGSQYLRNGVGRWLIRRAMEGKLPDQVRNRTTIGAQSSDWNEWFPAMKGEFRAELDRLDRSEMANRCLDLAKMCSLTDQWPERLSIEHHRDYHLMLLRGIMMGRFIRWFEETYS